MAKAGKPFGYLLAYFFVQQIVCSFLNNESGTNILYNDKTLNLFVNYQLSLSTI